MRSRRMALARPLLALVAMLAAIAAAVALVNQPSGRPGRSIESIFEDDQLLVYPPLTPAGNASVQRTLALLKGLGVTRLRLLVVWNTLAPDPRPAGFDATDPAAYPLRAWARYDRVDRLAHDAGLGVDFDLTAPGPSWAMAPGAPDAKTATHYRPSAADFEAFAAALGRRYDGRYRDPRALGSSAVSPLPRVAFWSVWNEPNQPGWLAPQWAPGPAAGAPVPVSAVSYRALVDAAFAGLAATGHTPRTDTILFGELAPEGSEQTLAQSPITPLPFLRALYCLDGADHRLTGAAASAVGCPAGGTASAFVHAHPGLFTATGFAHHPYSFFVGPDVSLNSDPNYVPLADLGRLERTLDAAFAAYGQSRRLPIYLTEYGYETSPPRPRGVFPPGFSLRDQSRYLDEAQYLAWQDPRVRSMGQFLLEDSPPVPGYPGDLKDTWASFQTGLEFYGGVPKPSLAAYRLPIFLPATTGRAGAPLLLWGMLRPARTAAERTAGVQWRPAGGRYRTVTTVSTANPSGVLSARVVLPGSGVVRLAWTAPGGEVAYSRGVGVTLR